MLSKRTVFVTTFNIFVILGTGFASQTVYYVDTRAAGSNDGSSWQNAYTCLQDGLARASEAQEPVEVRVAEGVYRPDQGAGMTLGNQKATFRLINGVTLRGGYAGFGQPDPNLRDVQTYETILSGDLQDNDPEVDDLVDLLSTNVGNSRTVVTGSGTDSTAVLDGFTITRGYFVISHLLPDPGAAGMHNLTGSPTVINCTFTRNASTGSAAMYNRQGSNPTLIDCVFTRNYAVMGGAAIANRQSSPKLVGCIFRDNDSLYSAAMLNLESSPVVGTCTFVRNSGFEGGAIYNLQSSPTLSGCLFQENTAGAGGAVLNDEGSTLALTACVFTGNSAKYGGAVWDAHSSVNSTISNCIFRMNLASRLGGAVSVGNSSVTNCIFAGNRALGLPPDPKQPSIGGAILTSTITLTNCTFDGNWAEFGRAIFGSRVSAQASNCIFWGSEDLIYCDHLAPPMDVRYSNIQHGWPGEGNIDTDPCFVRLGRWADPDDPNRAAEPNDPNAVWVDGDYHLKSQTGRWAPASKSWVKDDVTSPCIDAGDPNSPIGQEPFPNGGRVNMGAYGGTAEASKSYFGEPVCETVIAGDINGDCRVDFTDLQILVSHWLEKGDAAGIMNSDIRK
jgi:hypothetical protein